MTDWFIDLFFKRDVTRLKTPLEEKGIRSNFKKDKQKEDSEKMSVNDVKINTDWHKTRVEGEAAKSSSLGQNCTPRDPCMNLALGQLAEHDIERLQMI